VTARRDGGEYILNGAKSWVVAAPIADLAIVWAQVTAFPTSHTIMLAHCRPFNLGI
jgi:alkylation response protein AidB-like acyl-CoA dehydrogenase